MSQALAESKPTSRPNNGSATFEIRSVSPVLGAEVIGFDGSKPASKEDTRKLRDALNEFKVLVFRDQHLTKEQFVEFSLLWGSLGEHIRPGATRDGISEINVMSNADENGRPNGKHTDASAKRWHTDRSYMTKPAMATLLYGIEVPDEGGDTVFADACKAYDALDAKEREKIDALKAIHSVEFSRRTGGMGEIATEEEKRKAPNVMHPIARPHPETGKKAIYAGCHAWKVEGWSEEESRPLLDGLVKHATRPEFLYSHRWKKNDLVIWDNRCTMHAATDFDTSKYVRILWRTIVEDRQGGIRVN